MRNLSAAQLSCLSRAEQRELLEEAFQEQAEREKELAELDSMFDDLDDEGDYDLRIEDDYRSSYAEGDGCYDDADDYATDFELHRCLFVPSDFF